MGGSEKEDSDGRSYSNAEVGVALEESREHLSRQICRKVCHINPRP